MASRISFNRDQLTSGDKVVFYSPGHAPGMVTTVGPNQNVNVATFEQVMIVSYRPPRIMIAISDNSDTYKNIKDGSDFCVGFPYPECVQQAYDGGVKLDRGLSEIDYIKGLSTYKSEVIKSPSLNQCWVNFECKAIKDVPVGDHSMIVGDILYMSIDKEIVRGSGAETRINLPALYYTTHGNFFVPGDFTEVKLSPNLKFDNAD